MRHRGKKPRTNFSQILITIAMFQKKNDFLQLILKHYMKNLSHYNPGGANRKGLHKQLKSPAKAFNKGVNNILTTKSSMRTMMPYYPFMNRDRDTKINDRLGTRSIEVYHGANSYEIENEEIQNMGLLST